MEPLFQAIHYAVFSGGKRFRAFLTIQSAKLFDVSLEQALQAASAVELMHVYSLVHDDLPSMDNDDLRRGKPTVHIKWNEATAILVGDGIQAFAYEILSKRKTHEKASVRLKLISELSRAAGFNGMVLGQAKDLEAEQNSNNLDFKDVISLQKLKTGALFRWSLQAGALLAEQSNKALTDYSDAIGLAFQIKDDLLDYEGSEQETGKRLRKDESAGKATLVSLLGVDAAKKKAKELSQKACDSLAGFGDKSQMLRTAALFTITRGS